MSRALLAIATSALFLGFGAVADAQQAFKSPEQAASALLNAAKDGSRSAFATIFGPNGDAIVFSGDPVADAAVRQNFVAAYEAKHGIALQNDDRAMLVVGPEDYPLPIPLVSSTGVWRFDAAAGRREIIARRIGKNELDAIQTCLAYVDAQREYAAADRTGSGVGVYAQRLVSSPRKTDGLYWLASDGQDASPLGALFAEATAQGYNVGAGRAPYHGYYFKILTKQGAAAPGGELEYIVRGKMIGGFALVAYPAEYGLSGVMTFIVSHAGAVYQKNLGPDTAVQAERVRSFNPDGSWTRVSETAASTTK